MVGSGFEDSLVFFAMSMPMMPIRSPPRSSTTEGWRYWFAPVRASGETPTSGLTFAASTGVLQSPARR